LPVLNDVFLTIAAAFDEAECDRIRKLRTRVDRMRAPPGSLERRRQGMSHRAPPRAREPVDATKRCRSQAGARPAAAKAKAQEKAEERRQAEGRRKPGRPAAPPSDKPDPKAQKNFTDPESRIMKTKDGFIQGYNAQATVDAAAQVIVAHGLDARQSDQHQLAPMTDAIRANLGKKPAQLSADAGYCSDANLAAIEEREIDPYIAPGRAKHAADGEGGGARVAAMREKIKAGGHDSPIDCASNCPSRCSARSSRRAASASSCCAASRRLPPNGASSASPTMS
jgi:hypothetical protein